MQTNAVSSHFILKFNLHLVEAFEPTFLEEPFLLKPQGVASGHRETLEPFQGLERAFLDQTLAFPDDQRVDPAFLADLEVACPEQFDQSSLLLLH